MTCDSFCAGQQHPQCAGSWNISGVYPACSCAYVCPPATNATASANTSAPSGPVPEQINYTISQELSISLKETESDFYRNNSGSFLERTYTWSRLPIQTDMNDITFDAAPATDVTFDNKSIDSIVGAGFIVFMNKADNSTLTQGTLIFKGTQTALDAYDGGALFSIDFFPAMIDKRLRDCATYAKDYLATSDGDGFVRYSFVCWETLNK